MNYMILFQEFALKTIPLTVKCIHFSVNFVRFQALYFVVREQFSGSASLHHFLKCVAIDTWSLEKASSILEVKLKIKPRNHCHFSFRHILCNLSFLLVLKRWVLFCLRFSECKSAESYIKCRFLLLLKLVLTK